MSKSLMLLLLTLFVACTPGVAGIIYDNGMPDQQSGNEMTAWIQSEDFTLAAPAVLTGVGFWDIESSPGYAGSISWWIYADDGGLPGSVLFSGQTWAGSHIATGNAVLGSYTECLNVFKVSAALGVGTYHLGLHNGDSNHNSRDEFYWETTASNGTTTGLELPVNGTWSGNGQQHAFYLESATPEPASVLLVGGALFGLCVVLRRRA